MDHLAHTEEYKGFTIKIHWDTDPSNPRTEWDNASTMACWHSRYDLGDKDHGGFSTPEAFQEWAQTKQGRQSVILPLFLYDHSGLTISTGKFSCPWDSGQVGYVFMTRAAILKNWGWKVLTKARRAKVEALLIAEVETYDYYLTGQVYGYTIDDMEGAQLDDSCWGFLGEMSYCISEAKSAVDFRAGQLEQKAALAVL